MIDKLRKKLVAINLISVGVVFFIAILLIFSLGYSRIGEERNTRMASALTYDTTDNNFANEDIYKDMALALYDKTTDEIVWYKGCNFNYDVEELDSLCAAYCGARRNTWLCPYATALPNKWRHGRNEGGVQRP